MAFSIKESLLVGWRITRARSGLLFGVVLTGFVVQVAHAAAGRMYHGTFAGLFASVVLLAFGIVLGAGFMRIALKLVRGEHAVYADMIPPLPIISRFLLASLLVAALVVAGLILLVVPGIYLMVRYSMVRFTALESGGVIESLRTSAELTRGATWPLLRFLLALIGINIAGALALLAGLLVTIPVSILAYAHVYEKLLRRHAVRERSSSSLV